MKATFVEMTEFTEWVSQFLPDEAYASLQHEMMDDPECGAVIPGCGGLRKLRTADPKRGKGKRGGARVIYMYIPEVKQFYMLDIYDKNQQDDLSMDEKKALRTLAEELKREALATVQRLNEETE